MDENVEEKLEETPEDAFERADAEIEEALEETEDEILEKRDIYTQSAADIPAGANLIVTVRNRPYAYFIFGMIALAIFGVIAWFSGRHMMLIGVGVFALLFCVVMLFINNDPVIDIYDSCLVAHKSGEPDRLCIVPNEMFIYWSVVQQYTSVVEVFMSDATDPELAICVPIHSINSYRVSGALDKYYHNKSLVEIRRGVEKRKRERSKQTRGQ